MDEAGWQPTDVDLVNANGSSSVIYDRLEGMALAEVFGEALPRVSRALHQIDARPARGGLLRPPGGDGLPFDPAGHRAADDQSRRSGSGLAGPLRIGARAERAEVERVLVHSIGLGGFDHSVAAFEKPGEQAGMTGLLEVEWSKDGQLRFHPSEEFQKPLVPWSPRED